jgi:hypothetical protein
LIAVSANPLPPGRPMSNHELADGLCSVSSGLREVRRVHIERYETLIPHIFMSEVLAHVGTLCNVAADEEQIREVAAILAMLEQGMAFGSRETRSVISLSFVSDGQLEMFYAAMAPAFGPRLKREAIGRQH